MTEQEAIVSMMNRKGHLAAARRRWLEFLKVLEYRFAEPRVTSWWRTPEHNRAVGGVPTSKHLTGDAIDVVYMDGDPPDLHALHDVAGRFDVKVIREMDHDHFQFLYGCGGAGAGVCGADPFC